MAGVVTARPHYSTQPGDKLIPATMKLDENGNPVFSYPEPTPQKLSPKIVAPRSMISRLNRRRSSKSKKKQEQAQLSPELQGCPGVSLHSSLQLGGQYYDDHDSQSTANNSVASSVAGSVVSLAGRVKRRLHRHRRKKLEKQLEIHNGVLSPLKEISHDNIGVGNISVGNNRDEDDTVKKSKKKKSFKPFRRMSRRRSSTSATTFASSMIAEEENDDDNVLSPPKVLFAPEEEVKETKAVGTPPVAVQVLKSVPESPPVANLRDAMVLFAPEEAVKEKKVAGTPPVAVQVLKAVPDSPPPVASLRDAMEGISPVQRRQKTIQDDSFTMNEHPVQPASVTPMQGGILSAPALQEPSTRKQVTIVNPGDPIVIAPPEMLMEPAEDDEVEEEKIEEPMSRLFSTRSVKIVDPGEPIMLEPEMMMMESIAEDEKPVNMTLSSTYSQQTNFKVYLLLLHPTSKIFELIQLYVDPTATTIRDILLMIPLNATEPSLGAQIYTGLCRPRPKEDEQQDISDLDLLIENPDGIRDSARIAHGEVLTAVPVGYTCTKIANLSQQILVNPRICRLLDEPVVKKPKKRLSNRRRRRSSRKQAGAMERHDEGKLSAVMEEMDDPHVMSMHRAMANAMSAAAAANAAVHGLGGYANGSFFAASVSGTEESGSQDSLTLATTTLTDTSETSYANRSIDQSFTSWSRSLDVSIAAEAGNTSVLNTSLNTSIHSTVRRRKKKMNQVRRVVVGAVTTMCFVYWRDPQGYASREGRTEMLLRQPLEIAGMLQVVAFVLVLIKLQFLCSAPSIQSACLNKKSKCPFLKLRASIQLAADACSPKKRPRGSSRRKIS